MKSNKRQSGATIIFTAFALLMALGALGVLGVGQSVWEREKAQRMVDLASMAAATQLDDGPEFPLGVEVAERNGLMPADQLVFTCLANGQPTNNCSEANTARAVLTRTIRPFFIPIDQQLKVEAEATLAPVVTGLITSELANISTNQSIFLNQILRTLPGGSNLNLTAGNFKSLLGANLQVPLVGLAGELNTGSLTQLASLNVNAGNLLNESLSIAQGNPAEITAAQGVLGQLQPVLSGINLNFADVVAMTLENQSQGLLNFNFGDLALATLLNSAQGNTITLNGGQLGLAGFGLDLKMTLLQAPQVFIGRKLPGKFPIAQGETSQVGIRATISGLSVLGLSLANIELDTKVAGGFARVDQLECRIPRSNNSLTMTVQPSVTSTCVTAPGAIAGSQFTGTNQLLTCPAAGASLINSAVASVTIKGSANVQPNSSQFTFDGPAPYRERVPTNVGSTLQNTFSNLNLTTNATVFGSSSGSGGLGLGLNKTGNGLGLGLGGGGSSLLDASALTNGINSLLRGVFGQIGAVLDDTLGTLGVSLNNVDVSIQSVDCQAAVLTK